MTNTPGVKDDEILALAHRTATTYAHRSDPKYHAYSFVPHTMLDFARKLLALRADGVALPVVADHAFTTTGVVDHGEPFVDGNGVVRSGVLADGVTVDETIDYYGLPFKEARELILAMPAEEARGMAISLLIQNGLLRKNADGVKGSDRG